MKKLDREEVRAFVLNSVSEHPKDISAVTAKHFDISRQAAHRHIKSLVSDDLLTAEGATRKRSYALKPLVDYKNNMPIENLAEDKVWREHVAPLLKDVPANVFKICNYGFTEMVNNVIDHSEGSELFFSVMITAVNIELTVSDNGVGIFNKIQKEFQLDDPLHSLLELSKGKLTTDKTRHSGEGIFFTSRMFDFFVIQSGNISFAHMDYGSKSNNSDLGESDFLLEHKSNLLKGTSIKMQINTASEKTPQDVFDRYTLADTFGFTKTIVPVFLSSYGDENLISRSQAKRLLARFEVFKEIVLDFKMVKTIGQAFADEVFRVFQQQNPEIHIYPIRANKQIKTMIGHVTGKDPDSL